MGNVSSLEWRSREPSFHSSSIYHQGQRIADHRITGCQAPGQRACSRRCWGPARSDLAVPVSLEWRSKTLRRRAGCRAGRMLLPVSSNCYHERHEAARPTYKDLTASGRLSCWQNAFARRLKWLSRAARSSSTYVQRHYSVGPVVVPAECLCT